MRDVKTNVCDVNYTEACVYDDDNYSTYTKQLLQTFHTTFALEDR